MGRPRPTKAGLGAIPPHPPGASPPIPLFFHPSSPWVWPPKSSNSRLCSGGRNWAWATRLPLKVGYTPCGGNTGGGGSSPQGMSRGERGKRKEGSRVASSSSSSSVRRGGKRLNVPFPPPWFSRKKKKRWFFWALVTYRFVRKGKSEDIYARISSLLSSFFDDVGGFLFFSGNRGGGKSRKWKNWKRRLISRPPPTSIFGDGWIPSTDHFCGIHFFALFWEIKIRPPFRDSFVFRTLSCEYTGNICAHTQISGKWNIAFFLREK